MSDNEHTLAPLGHPEILSVKNACGGPIAELAQGGDEAVKIVGLINFLKRSRAEFWAGVNPEVSAIFDSRSKSRFESTGRRMRRVIAPTGMNSGHILPNDPGWLIFFND